MKYSILDVRVYVNREWTEKVRRQCRQLSHSKIVTILMLLLKICRDKSQSEKNIYHEIKNLKWLRPCLNS